MALTLHSQVRIDDTSIDVDGADPITTDYLTIDDEIMAVQSIGTGTVHYPGALGYQVVGVRRAQLGSNKATHSVGASISQTLALGGGGGVSNDAPADAVAISDGTNLTGSALFTSIDGQTVVAPVKNDDSTDVSLTVRAAATGWGETGGGTGLLVTNPSGSHDYMKVADPNEDGTVMIRPEVDANDGLVVYNAASSGAIAFATSLGDGDATVIDRMSVHAHGGDHNAGSGEDLISIGDRALRTFVAPDDASDPYPGGVFRVMYGGAIVTGQRFAPPTADLAAGQVAMWFDSSNGAAKVMFKGKTEDGTVVTGSLSLT